MTGRALFVLLMLPASVLAAGRVRGSVKAEGGLAASTVVYVHAAAPPSAAAPAAVPPTARPRMMQKNATFAPGVLVVEAGTTVDFPNEDKIYHNVFSLTPGNEFDLGLYRGGVSKSTQLTTPGEVSVYCNIHPEMVARVLVVPPGLHAKVGADGRFTLEGVAPGAVEVTAWSPDHEPVTVTITVKEGGDATADFDLSKRKATRTHLNKSGEQYGRYK